MIPVYSDNKLWDGQKFNRNQSPSVFVFNVITKNDKFSDYDFVFDREDLSNTCLPLACIM